MSGSQAHTFVKYNFKPECERGQELLDAGEMHRRNVVCAPLADVPKAICAALNSTIGGIVCVGLSVQNNGGAAVEGFTPDCSEDQLNQRLAQVQTWFKPTLNEVNAQIASHISKVRGLNSIVWVLGVSPGEHTNGRVVFCYDESMGTPGMSMNRYAAYRREAGYPACVVPYQELIDSWRAISTTVTSAKAPPSDAYYVHIDPTLNSTNNNHHNNNNNNNNNNNGQGNFGPHASVNPMASAGGAPPEPRFPNHSEMCVRLHVCLAGVEKYNVQEIKNTLDDGWTYSDFEEVYDGCTFVLDQHQAALLARSGCNILVQEIELLEPRMQTDSFLQEMWDKMNE